MIRQVFRLSRLQLANLFGINEFRYTKDRKKKNRYLGLATVWSVLFGIVVVYIVSIAAGLVEMGIGKVIPMYMYTVSSVLILMFTIFKAGSMLFSMKGYEMIVSLPVSKAAIVISRFIAMYVTNLFLTLLIMVPAVAVYGILEGQGITFYIMFMIGTLFTPMLPLTLASIIGAGITAISARAKHKSIMQAILTIVLLVALMGGSMLMSDKGDVLSEEMLMNMSGLLETKIGELYPPALWFGKAVFGEWSYMAGVVLLPLIILTLFVAVLQRYFQSICTMLNATISKNNYKMEKLSANGVIKALWKRELRRYFSSGVYVTNSIIGYVMAAIGSIALWVLGIPRLLSFMGIAGMGMGNVENMMYSIIPFVVSTLMSMTSITSCSISMEGKTFWQIQTLPIRNREVYLGKILANLIVAAPFYIISVFFICLSVPADVLTYIKIAIVPAVYLLFTATVGIRVNLKFPVLNWDNEVRVVKQSASTMLCMLIGVLANLIPIGAILILGSQYADIVIVTVIALVGITTLVVYHKLEKKKIDV